MRRITAILGPFLLVLGISGVALAGGSAGKVTGSATFANPGAHQVVEVTAHEAKASRPAKGFVSHIKQDDSTGAVLGTLLVDLEFVDISDDGTWACVGGWITEASGEFANKVGTWRWALFIDGGSGQDETGADYYRGGGGMTTPQWCGAASDVNGRPPARDGNIQIHIGSAR